jgi:hypothetical protein
MQDDDRTLIMFPPDQGNNKGSGKPEGLRVTLLQAGQLIGEPKFFAQDFRAGRALDNDLVIPLNMVSRHHLEVRRDGQDWWLHDLGSANGLFIQDDRVLTPLRLVLPVEVRLGDSACFLCIEVATDILPADFVPLPQSVPSAKQVESSLAATVTKPAPVAVQQTGKPSAVGVSKEAIRARLLAESEAEDAGDYTKMVRQLIHEDRHQRGNRYRKVIWGVAALLVLTVGMVVYQQMALSKARTLAIDMFYDIKSMELNLAQAEIQMDEQAEMLKSTIKAVESDKLKAEEAKLAATRQRVAKEREKLRDMRKKYQGYVQEAKALRIHFPTASAYEQELIMRVAREFGESELEVPPGFVKEVKRYIGYWQGSPRLASAVQRVEANGHKPVILNALATQNLPLHFICLPLQESNFNPQAIGPPTRYGIAKGAWQFLASTGQEFGLKPGPLAASREYDPQDERFDFNKASIAGARYLKQIYSTEAQASGLLVMAGYNYGHNRVRGLVRKMPENPRDRNFWKFIQQNQIPQETYDYVFYIFAAAVIGEDPKHFGFRFKPLLSP